jgi:thiamine-phosphate pyrophosphorylase
MLANERRARLSEARLYLVCDSRPGGRELLDVLGTALAGGVDVVQLREKHMDDDALTALARAAVALCARAGALLIVNDRPAVALAAGADGVHVGQEDMPVAQVRELVGEDLLIGLSTHAPEEVDAAGEADYLGVGPVHATPTKPGRPAVGLELVRYAAQHAPKPFFAIGGIDAGNIGAVVDAGATRVAVVRAIAEAADPEAAARELRGGLQEDGWPRPLVAAIAVSVLLAVAVMVGAASVHDLSRRGGSLLGAIFLAAVLLALASGMCRRRYWAVLGFEALLAFQIVVTSLALVVASTLPAAAVCVVSVGLGGWLFWKLVKVMGRLQVQNLR